ncbi:MAG: M28 family metallopeptidase [Isosphaeraceae bacterium]
MRERRVGPKLSSLLTGPGESIVPPAKAEYDAARRRALLNTACGAIAACLMLGGLSSGRGEEKDAGAAKSIMVVPEQARLEAFVKTLAAPEMEGRSGAGARKAAALLIEEFRRLKLTPLFANRYEQEIPAREPGAVQGRNVGAILRGRDPKLRDQWVIVAAHFDHMGKRGNVIYPGADDNASGVAMMLEVARSIARAPEPPRRSLMFIGFDLEEIGLFGSRYFVAHPPVPLKQVVLFITADMIGRSFAGVCQHEVFVMGTEHVPGLRPWIDEAARDQPVKLGLLGSDVLILNRSDYGPFRTRHIPFLFFSTGENPRYHSPDDTPETLDYPKLTAISRVIHRVAASVADAAEVPHWSDAPDHPLAEAITLRDVISKLLENQKALKLGSPSVYLMKNTLRTLEEIIHRGRVTSDERASVLQAARLVLILIH